MPRAGIGPEELGKKDDDYRPARNGSKHVSPWLWTQTISTPRIRRRRAIVAVLALIGLYFFFKNIPTNLQPVSQRYDIRVPGQTYSGAQLPSGFGGFSGPSPNQAPARPESKLGEDKHYYNGEVRFYTLAASLHAIAKTTGYRPVNKNVMFAAGSLRSVSRLLPMACEMSRWNRNSVHMILMGREDLPLEDIRAVNGVGEGCEIFWHDARPDFGRWSTDHRMGLSVRAAMDHIQTFMHPQVLLIDDPKLEEAYFVQALRSETLKIGKALIELPADASSRMLWITRLDSGSLSAWHTTYVDILIQAPSGSSGSLIRLLKSIEQADYFGVRRPRLTIELPAKVDRPTQYFVDNMVWPPLDKSGIPHTSSVTIRRRVPEHHPTSEEASVKLVEAFYPIRTRDSHVLVLSPQVELSPLYYHYLLYNVLEYKYSTYAQDTIETDRLLGISLALPASQLDDSRPLVPPENTKGQEFVGNDAEQTCLFLWQAPDHNAVLYFGDKWKEFHHFLTTRIRARETLSPAQRPRVTSTNRPTWTEYLLELMRIRNMNILYPNLPSYYALATIHNELYIPTEEERNPSPPSDPDPQRPPTVNPKDTFTASGEASSVPHQQELPLLTYSLTALLPNAGDLPELTFLPLLSHTGEPLRMQDAELQSTSFASGFRKQVGKCEDQQDVTTVLAGEVDDLFCFDEAGETGSPVEFSDSASGSVLKPPPPPSDLPIGPNAETKETVQEFNAHLARQGKMGEAKKS